MSDAKAQQEPSMEEILASIRRIISEDAEGQKPGAAPEASAAASVPGPELGAEPEHSDDGDILELTDKVNDDGSVVSLGRGDGDFPDLGGRESKPNFSLDDKDFGGDKDEIAFDQDEFSEALMSGKSSAAAASAFAQLEQEMSTPPRPTASSAAPSMGGGLTLEQLVMDAVRPMLKDWLDTNLPGLVEDLVRAEIERVAQAGRRR
jgi:cell pole-organizing protein PopZ